jgi:hypothetical protein
VLGKQKVIVSETKTASQVTASDELFTDTLDEVIQKLETAALTSVTTTSTAVTGYMSVSGETQTKVDSQK